MGSGPSTDLLIKEHLNNLPVAGGSVVTGEQAYQFYQEKNHFTDISLFNDPQFERKISSLKASDVQAERLWHLANRVNMKAQGEFDAKNA